MTADGATIYDNCGSWPDFRKPPPLPSVHIFLTFLKKHKGTVFKKVHNTNFVFLPIFTLPFLF